MSQGTAIRRQSDFGRRKAYIPGVPYRKGIMIAAIILAVIGGTLLFFVKPYFVFGPILLIGLVAIIVKYPVSGLYLYMLVTYLRPQDLFGFLVILRPNIALLALTVISLVIHRRLENRDRLTLLPNDKAFLAFLMAAMLSNVTSVWFSSSMETTGELAKVAVFYFTAVMLLDTQERLTRYLNWYTYSVGFVSLVQIWTYLTVGLNMTTGKGGYGIIIGGATILGGTGPIKEATENVNGVGGYSSYFYANASELGLGLCIAYPISYYLFRATGNKWLKLLFLGLTGVFIYSIVVTGSRGAFVGFVATLIYILYKEKKLIVGLVVAAFLAAPATFLVSDQYVQRIKSIGEYKQDVSVEIRFQVWRAALSMVADHPLFGVGTGNFATAYGSIYRAAGDLSSYTSPHNIFVQVFAELGLFGITIYLTFIAAIFYINRKTRQMLRAFDDARSLVLYTHAIDVALVGYIVAGQFITATYYPHLFQFSVWASAIYLMARNKVNETHVRPDAATSAV